MLTRMAPLLTRLARMARMLTRMTRWLAGSHIIHTQTNVPPLWGSNCFSHIHYLPFNNSAVCYFFP